MSSSRRETLKALLAGLGAAILPGPTGNVHQEEIHPESAPAGPGAETPPVWERIRRVRMGGDYRIFWNVACWDPSNATAARARGFQTVDLINSLVDQKRGGDLLRIFRHIEKYPTNPWKKPKGFETTVRRNMRGMSNTGTLVVHDIEIGFEQDPEQAWKDPAAREASGARTLEEFAVLYWREWASWFYLPCKWTRLLRPDHRVGLYGVQPFHCDYWGVFGRDAAQIDGTHARDADLWEWIDPHVGFYTASIYLFYDQPDSVFYMASNVEENWRRTRRYGDKPVYAYTSLRYHPSNPDLAGKELAPWLAEAMAIVPWFSGARGVVLWGYEPDVKGQPYRQLPVFMESLNRIAAFSDRLTRCELVMDEAAHVLWKNRQPLVRKMRFSENEWYVMAVNPWQAENEMSVVRVDCGERTWNLELRGRHTSVFRLHAGELETR